MKKSTDIKFKSHWLEILQPFSFSVKGEVLEAVYIYLTSGYVAVNMSETAAVAFSFIRHEIDSAAARKAVAARRRTEKTAAPSTVEKPATSVADTATAEPSPQHRVPAAAPGPNALTRLPRKLKKSLKKQIAAAAARRDHHRLNRYPIDASAVRMADMKV